MAVIVAYLSEAPDETEVNEFIKLMGNASFAEDHIKHYKLLSGDLFLLKIHDEDDQFES